MPDGKGRRANAAIAAAMLGIALSGCTTMADFSYSEYRFGPSLRTESVYESRVYGDTRLGVGAESCGTVVRQVVDAFGDVSLREETVCDGF